MANYYSTQFKLYVKSARGKMVHDARNAAGELFGLSPALFCSKVDRSKILELQVLLNNPHKLEEKYPVLAPILFPEGNCTSKNAFAVNVLPRVSLRPYYFASTTRITN